MRTNNNFEKIEITGLNDLACAISRVDNAAPAELFYGNVAHPQPLKRWQGVYNINTEEMASVVSEGYQIIQHSDVIQATVETLGRLNLDVKGRLNNYRNKVVADLVFHTKGAVVKDDATGIQIGIRVVNSYNKSSSFRLEMFGFRTICQNGMSFGQSFGVVETTIHYGSKEKNLVAIAKITEKFIAKVIDSSELLQKYVDRMLGDSLEYDMAKQIATNLLKVEKHREAILSRLEICKTRWDFYNAMTNYITHGEHLTPNVKSYLESVSQKVMQRTVEQLATVPSIEVA